MSLNIALERFDAQKDIKSGRSVKSLSEIPPLRNDDEIRTATSDHLDPVPIARTPEPQLTSAELADRELATKVKQFDALVKSLPSELRAARDRAANDMAQTLGAAFSSLLPNLIDHGLAHEVAQASLQIAMTVQPQEIQLALHPDDHVQVIEALRKMQPPQPVTVVENNSIKPGCASLSWNQGGAEIDRSALLQQATTLLDTKLASMTTGDHGNEH